MSAPNEVSFKTYNTRRNLPPHTGRCRKEANFVGTFLKSLMGEGSKDGYWCGRHFAIPDCGVADCVLFRFEGTGSGQMATHLIAFEAKLLDWRKALVQAFRYRYYADESIVVLPVKAARQAVKSRHLFRQFGVGLWTLNLESGAVCPRIAAKAQVPLNARKREQALLRIERRVLQLRNLRKKAEPLKHCR